MGEDSEEAREIGKASPGLVSLTVCPIVTSESAVVHSILSDTYSIVSIREQ